MLPFSAYLNPRGVLGYDAQTTWVKSHKMRAGLGCEQSGSLQDDKVDVYRRPSETAYSYVA